MSMTQETFIDQFKLTWGFDPQFLYCEATGKPIGYMWDDEFNSIRISLKGDGDSQIDDMAMRLLASMRPSLKWNKMREESLADMRTANPLETLAYLMNRLFTERSQKEQWAVTRTNRIVLWGKLKWAYDCMTNLESTRDEGAEALPERHAFEQLTLWLLEVEAKMNLLTEAIPFPVSDLFSLNELHPSYFPKLVERLTKWYNKAIERHREAEADARFYQKNPLARKAFVDAWFANAPKSQAQEKREAKQKEEGVLDMLFRQVEAATKGTVPDVTQPTTAAPPVKQTRPLGLTKAPMKFGVKSNG